MKRLFIDTNIYLTFYHFSSDDLEELKKLLVAVKNNKIKLYVTRQVVNEFRKNREVKIADALKIFKAQKLPDQFPQICKAYEEYNELRNLLKSFAKSRAKLLEKLKQDIDTNRCGADTIIDSLFDVATTFEIDGDIIETAKNRIAMGNPPGKDNSHGDAISWELLLKNFPNNKDLHFITGDTDYSSKIEENKLAEFLNLEWKEKKHSSIYYYTRLSDFLRSEFPDIKLAAELEKELAITDFVNSHNFAETHLAIEKLRKVKDFSNSEIRTLIEASTNNSQIYLINEDDDVIAFLSELIEGKEDILGPELLDEFYSIYMTESEEDSHEDDEAFP